MGNDKPSRVCLEQTLQAWNIPSYEYIDSTDTIVGMMQALGTIGVEQLSLVTIGLQFELNQQVRQQMLLQQIEQSTGSFLGHLRSLVRKTDVVFIRQMQSDECYMCYTFYFLLLEASIEGAEIVQTRLWDALLWCIHSTGEPKIVRPSRMQLGYSATTTSCASFHSCIEAATAPQCFFERETRQFMRKVQGQRYALTLEAQEYDLPQIARQFGIPYLSLLPRKLPAHVLRLVDPKLAQELRCYPLGRNKDVLTVAIANPQDRSSLCVLEQITGMHIFPVLAPPLELQTALEQLI